MAGELLRQFIGAGGERAAGKAQARDGSQNPTPAHANPLAA
jgi:hypothetical protein